MVSKWLTVQEINKTHLGKRNIIFNMDFSGDMLVPQEGIDTPNQPPCIDEITH